MPGFFSFLSRSKTKSGRDLNTDRRLPEEEPIILESIIDGDDRVVVRDVTKEPWRKFCCLSLDFGGGATGLGTGVLIAPDIVLTAAHNLYSLNRKSFVKSIVAKVGVVENRFKASARGDRVEVNPGYKKHRPNDPRKYMSDFGVVRLANTSPHDWASSLCDVESIIPFSDQDLKTIRLNIAGYPDEGLAPMLHRHDGGAIHSTIRKTVFSYKIDTMPGQSGAPVFGYDAATKHMRLAGLHVAGGTNANSARRYDASMQKQVSDWVTELSRHKAPLGV